MKKLFYFPCLLVLGLFTFQRDALAQADSIFGGAPPTTADPGFGDPNSIPPNADAAAPVKVDEHAVVRSLQRDPPRSAIEISRAILYMMRIGRWDEVARYLDQLAKMPIDRTVAIQMERSAGFDVWLRIASQAEGLNDAQRHMAKKVLDLASESIRNPESLAKALEALKAPELIERKRGVLALQSAGEMGVARLLQSIASTDTFPTPFMSEAIISMGIEGESALKAALATEETKAFERLLAVAARIRGSGYMSELVTGYYSLNAESPTHRLIAQSLSPAGQPLPSIESSKRFVQNELESQVRSYRRFRGESSPSINSLWRWSRSRDSLTVELDDAAGVPLERAYQLAQLLLRLGHASSVDTSLASAVILERDYRLTRTVEIDQARLQSVLKPGSRWGDFDALGSVWEAAKEFDLSAAQLRVVQAFAMAAATPPLETSSTLSRLTEAVKHGSPAIRYAAVAALQKWTDTTDSFEGKYAMEQTLHEMQRLESKPLAIVIGGSPDLRDSFAKQLSQLAIRSLPASNAREALRVLQEPQPIEYVFVVDRVLDMSVTELVQRVRTYPRTRRTPIAVLTDAIGPDQRSLLVDEGLPSVQYSAVTNNINLTAELIQEMQRCSTVPLMDSVDRIVFRSVTEPSSP